MVDNTPWTLAGEYYAPLAILDQKMQCPVPCQPPLNYLPVTYILSFPSCLSCLRPVFVSLITLITSFFLRPNKDFSLMCSS